MKSLTAYTIGVVLLWSFAGAWAADNNPDHTPKIKSFIDFMVTEHGFERESLSRLLGKAVYKPRIIRSMDQPAEHLPWHRYQRIFLTEKRILGGIAFWQDQQQLLQRATERYHVPSEVIVAIIGLESEYGAYRGKTKVLDALYTLAFHYPRRSKFFRGELIEFLLLAHSGMIDPRTATGSYAGAMGIPQFIASSYKHFAVDFDSDGRRNLNSEADAIGSVANYLSQHQWQPQGAIALRAKVRGVNAKALLAAGYKPHTTLAALQEAGIQFDTTLPITTTSALITLANQENNEHWVVLDNFYSITRYNHSPLYAMAVFQLASAIKKRFDR